MTLETCKLMLESAKARGDNEAVAEYEARIARKLKHPKYANLPKESNSETKPKDKK